MSGRRRKKNNAVGVLSAIIAVLTVALIVVIIVIVTKNSKVDSGNTSSPAVVTSVPSAPQNTSSVASSLSGEASSSTPDNSAASGVSWTDTITAGSGYEDWNLVLVNSQVTLDAGDEPQTVKISSNGTNYLIDARIADAFNAMLADAKADGVNLTICSGFRYYTTQQRLYNNKVNYYLEKGYTQETAESTAATIVARPGTSEHQTGLAIDFNPCNDSFGSSKAYKWLSKHAADYGFVQRYKSEKSDVTGIVNEAWHFRFVGVGHARAMNEHGYCLEEYIDYLKAK